MPEEKPGILNSAGQPVTPPKEEPRMIGLKTSLDFPQFRVLDGGLLVLTIPLNSKAVNRIIALGMIEDAKQVAIDLYRQMEFIKAKHEMENAKVEQGLVAKAKAAIDKVIH